MKTLLKREYSAEQKNSIEIFGKNICVSAAAGSGKTTILVERFLNAILEKKMSPDRILAITFTEKAANEMKSRLIARCRKRGLPILRRSLETAYISTIHGFCSRLLKENPIESGIDPFFQVLGDGEAEILMNETLDGLFENESENERWLHALSVYGEKEMRTSIKSFYTMDRALLRFENRPVKDLSALARQTERKIISELQTLLCLCADPDSSDSEIYLKEAALQIIELLQKSPLKGWDLIHALYDLKETLHRRIKKTKDCVDRARRLIDIWISLKVEALAEPLKSEFMNIFSKFKNAYDREKRRLGTYDFDDLLFLTYRLLSGGTEKQKAVRERTRELFLAILVDEYQDTSPLQDRIIGLLTKEDNLFIVGDVRQSIYGFRYADPDVFEKRIASARSSPFSAHIALGDNYRSRTEILSFVNKIFGKFFEGHSFEPLKSKRTFGLKKRCSIGLLCVPCGGEEGWDLERSRIVEARSLASFIKERVEKGVLVEKDGIARPVAWGDFAILLRSTTPSYLYEKELSDLGVPYYAPKSEGFYEKPEIMDFLNLLKLIENPELDIPLAGVLRSPLVHLSDDALFWLARKAKTRDHTAPLFDALERADEIAELPAEDRSKLEKFKSWFLALRKNKNRIKIMAIFERALSETQYEAKLLTRREGFQAVANVRKLVEMARRAGEKRILGIEDFIRFAQAMADREGIEPEAKIQSTAHDSVTILTIHAAKGLEFPFVILANMGAEPKKNHDGIFLNSPALGMGAKLRSPKTREFFKDFTFFEIDKTAGEKERTEEDRLLYVAMTRAEEELILSGAVNRDKSWMSRIVKILGGQDIPSENEIINFEGIAIKRLRMSDKPIFAKARPWILADEPVVGERLKAFQPIGGEETSGPFTDIMKRLEASKKDYEEKEDLTVTDLLLASMKQTERKEEILAEETKFSEDDNEILMPRNEYGTLFHRIMELLAIERPKKVTRSFLARFLRPDLSSAQRNEMEESILKFWISPLGQAVRMSKKCYPELPFIYKTKYGILKGQIDLIYRDETGHWVVVDYKTHQIPAVAMVDVAADYEFQLALYALIFKKLSGEDPLRGVLYFSVLSDSTEFIYQKEDFEKFENQLNIFYERILRAPNGVLVGKTQLSSTG